MKTLSPAAFGFALLLIATSALRAADVPASDLGRNAALIYWQAFDQYDSAAKNEEFVKAINESATIAIDDHVRKIFKDSEALKLLRMASAIEPCDWGMGMVIPQQGPYTLLPHLSKCRSLGRLGLMSVRIHLADKKGATAVADLIAVLRLARHSQADRLLLSMLVGNAIDATALDFIAQNLTAFTPADLELLQKKMAELPPLRHVKETVYGERAFLTWMKTKLAKLEDRTSRDEMFALFDAKQKLQIMAFTGGDFTKLDKLLTEMEEMYEPVEKILSLPPAEFRAENAKWVKKVEESKNVMMSMALPAYGNAYDAYHRNQAIGAIVRAAMVYRLQGKEKFEAIRDPYGDGPFTVTPTEDGIEISSKFVTKRAGDKEEKPVSVKVKWKP